MSFWSTHADRALAVLSEHTTVSSAAEALTEEFGRRVTGNTLDLAFRRLGLGPPGQYLAKTTEPPSPGAFSYLGSDRADSARKRHTRRLERELGDREYLTRAIQEALTEALRSSPVRIMRYGDRPVFSECHRERLVSVMVSDTHFGLQVDPREVTGNRYDWQVAARRMARLATEVAEWKPTHRHESRLQVVLNGDILAGRIHLDDVGLRLLTEQIHGATSILVSFLDYLGQSFPEVEVLCLPGNHDRVRRERQVAQRWDSHAHAVFFAIAQAFRGIGNVHLTIPRTGDGVVELPGGTELAYYTHGDVAPTIKNVGRSLNLEPIEAAANRLNASREYDKPIRVLGWGHWHSGCVFPAGIATAIVNGCVIGPDAYARNGVGVRGNESEPKQIMFESVPGYAFGDSRWVHLRPADDDERYDRIIPTPSLDEVLS